MSKSVRRAIIATTTVLLAIAVVLALASGLYLYRHSLHSHPLAELHNENDAGYIPVSAEPPELDLSSPQAFVYDCTDETILYRKGEERVVYPASTTKLLTILCALKYLSPDEVITPGDELSLVGEGSSLAYIKPYHALTVEMLIEGMLLPSGNDAAYVLAAAAGNRIDGSATGASAVDVFMREMAAYGARIGLVGTNFTCPDGLSDDTHYSTIEDIILISRLALQNDIIRRYAAMPEDDVIYASGHSNHWENTNELLHPDHPWYHAAVTGLKTGSLEHNYCLIFSFEQQGKVYIAGLFGAWDKDTRYADAHIILNALLRNKEVAR